jgi:D-sedoheptulose 7-phosphate isomerase
VVRAVETAREGGLFTLALTGPAPNALERASEDALAVEAETTATVQEVHQVVVHLLCASVDEHVAELLR